MKRNQAYVLLVGLLIVVLFLAGLYWSTKNSPQSTSLPPTESDILNENAASGSLQAQQFTQSQLKQLYGEAYPLALGPVDQQYKLKGRITNVISEDKVLVPGFLSRAHAQFEYLGAQKTIQLIQIPLIVENQETNQTVFLMGKIADSLSTKEEVAAYLKEELAFTSDPIETSISFAPPRTSGDMMLAEDILRNAINLLHPDGFSQFIQTGDRTSIGNTNNWLVPIYITLNRQN